CLPGRSRLPSHRPPPRRSDPSARAGRRSRCAAPDGLRPPKQSCARPSPRPLPSCAPDHVPAGQRRHRCADRKVAAHAYAPPVVLLPFWPLVATHPFCEGDHVSSKERNLLLLVLAGFAAFGAWLISFNPEHMNFMCQEDGFVEYSQAFLYLFAAGIFAYVASHKGYRNLWYWGYAALFFLVCGEEVAWAQRIFDVTTPTA